MGLILIFDWFSIDYKWDMLHFGTWNSTFKQILNSRLVFFFKNTKQLFLFFLTCSFPSRVFTWSCAMWALAHGDSSKVNRACRHDITCSMGSSGRGKQRNSMLTPERQKTEIHLVRVHTILPSSTYNPFTVFTVPNSSLPFTTQLELLSSCWGKGSTSKSRFF